MKTILFPTDFSANASHAAQYAAMLARFYNAHVILLHSYSIPIVSDYEQPYDTENLISEVAKSSTENLQFFTNKFIKDTNFPKEQITQMVEFGMLSDMIVEIAKAKYVDFIVMGTTGASNLVDRWLGTNAEKVMETAECPVWIVPEKASLNAPKTIMYAADFKENESEASHKLLEIVKPLGATCKVIHIHEYFAININAKIKQVANELNKEFQEEDITFTNLNRDDIVQGLESYIATLKPDVLAMAVYEKSFLSKIFISSTTQHFVQNAVLPMLFFRKP